jgi:hypothetical protein
MSVQFLAEHVNAGVKVLTGCPPRWLMVSSVGSLVA